MNIKDGMAYAVERANELFGNDASTDKSKLEWIFLEGYQQGIVSSHTILNT